MLAQLHFAGLEVVGDRDLAVGVDQVTDPPRYAGLVPLHVWSALRQIGPRHGPVGIGEQDIWKVLLAGKRFLFLDAVV